VLKLSAVQAAIVTTGRPRAFASEALVINPRTARRGKKLQPRAACCASVGPVTHCGNPVAHPANHVRLPMFPGSSVWQSHRRAGSSSSRPHTPGIVARHSFCDEGCDEAGPAGVTSQPLGKLIAHKTVPYETTCWDHCPESGRARLKAQFENLSAAIRRKSPWNPMFCHRVWPSSSSFSQPTDCLPPIFRGDHANTPVRVLILSGPKSRADRAPHA